MRHLTLLPYLLAGSALALASYLGYLSYQTNQALVATRSELATTTAENSSLTGELASVQADNEQLTDRLAAEIAKNEAAANQIKEIQGTVNTLTKITQTDKELLQKYSRVYFLNENYIPSSLSNIDSAYVLESSRTYQIHTKVKPYLENMLSDAQDADAPLLVLSGYRSFAAQAALKSSYRVTYGSGANRFSADQGYSEHQLGTAVDLTTKELGTTSLAFATSPSGVWLETNAYKYGFILSYPKANTYYQYEPWHFRFVGVALATELHDANKNFYDLPQRDIDTHLVSIFD
ncbi:MAG: peptidase and DD-carboxypeptidase VanY/endolysin [Parcubacteria group bacterium]|nr:peptidase and DD-carboxypeptidase VanY/endolysin [Parcubacteria group bacterium]